MKCSWPSTELNELGDVTLAQHIYIYISVLLSIRLSWTCICVTDSAEKNKLEIGIFLENRRTFIDK